MKQNWFCWNRIKQKYGKTYKKETKRDVKVVKGLEPNNKDGFMIEVERSESARVRTEEKKRIKNLYVIALY